MSNQLSATLHPAPGTLQKVGTIWFDADLLTDKKIKYGDRLRLHTTALPLSNAAPSLQTVPQFRDTARKEKPPKKQGLASTPKLASHAGPVVEKRKYVKANGVKEPTNGRAVISLSTGKVYPNQKSCAADLGVGETAVTQHMNKRTFSVGGHKLDYASQEEVDTGKAVGRDILGLVGSLRLRKPVIDTGTAIYHKSVASLSQATGIDHRYLNNLIAKGATEYKGHYFRPATPEEVKAEKMLPCHADPCH